MRLSAQTGSRMSQKQRKNNLCNMNQHEGKDSFIMKTIRVMGNDYKAMLDSAANRNYISHKLISRLKLSTSQMEEPYELKNAENTTWTYNNGLVERIVEGLSIDIIQPGQPTRSEVVTFDVTDIGDKEFILGRTWFYESNPTLEGRTGLLRWRDTAASPTNATHDRRSPSPRKAMGESTVLKEKRRNLPRNKEHKNRQHKLYKVLAHIRADLKDANDHLRKIRPKDPEELNHETPEQRAERLKNIPEQYRRYSVFQKGLDTGLPKHSRWDHKIELKDGTEPSFSKIYHLNHEENQTLFEYIEENLEKGYIRPSESSAGHPVMFVPKKDGKLRLVIDYRKLNDITVKDRTPLPLITELRDRLHGKKWFTAIDLKGAYNLIRIADSDVWKTAFRTRFGLYESLVMPFGLTNAPAAFQKMIDNVLRQYLDVFVVAYLDDILIFSETEEQHERHVHLVLKALGEANLLVEPKKSHFHTHQVTFLGHDIRPNEIRMEYKKIQAVKEWAVPTNVKEVQAFLGFANYYRRFITKFSIKVASLTNLTKKNILFLWDDKI